MQRIHLNLLCCALLALAFLGLTSAENKFRTPARILAKQTGATQFEEERYETHTNCNEHKHHLKKRASDEDVDYEVYQGVVGRPGIDFPIYPRIPKTSFSCRSYGNGYFADMETDCQVFHICEEGRKISFLCPNGTIFQQSELTCDWWFKVNCLGSSGYYAESAEILNKQRVHRVRPSVPVQGFNIVGGGLNIKPKATPRPSAGKSERRFDSNEEVQPSLENVDFEDVSGEKQRKVSSIDNNNNEQELQITAESSSFVGGTSNSKRRKDNLNSNDEGAKLKPSEQKLTRSRSSQERHSQRAQAAQAALAVNNESTERARNGQRGQQRYREQSKPSQSQDSAASEGDSREYSKELSKELSKEQSKEQSKELRKELRKELPTPRQRSNEKLPQLKNINAASKPEFYEAHSTHTTPYYTAGSYSTARRLEATKTTPYYTPTVPSVVSTKSKSTTEGKLNFIKTTPSPKSRQSGGVFIESSVAPRPTASAELKPIVIGMRHHYDVAASSSSSAEFKPRLSLKAKAPLNVDQPLNKLSGKLSESRDYLPSTTTSSPSTGPTYLPKVGSSPKSKAADAAGGDALLFAPNPVKEESIFRNVQDMLKTMNLLKDKFEDVEQVPARAGLEIPPSSGPDALVSLAKYFAQEHNETKATNSLDGGKTKLSAKPSSSSAPLKPKPSDTTASLTTPATPLGLSDHADDIKHSLLSDNTVQRYSTLFGLKDVKGRGNTEDLSKGLLSNSNSTATAPSSASGDNYQQFPQIGSTGSTIGALSTQPDSRKIAQIFSNALSSYLDDPNSFRAELAARARPTEPPTAVTANFQPVTSTDSSLFSDGTAKYYLPTKPTTEATTTTPSIAAEINHKFDSTPSSEFLTTTTESYEASTYRSSELELSAELSPPSLDSAEGNEELLLRQHTQSFVKSHHNLLQTKPEKLINKPTTEAPWLLKSQTDFLDPLTINDGLMKERPTTPAPFAYLPSKAPQSRHNSAQLLEEGRQQQAGYEWDDIFRSYDIPREALPSSSGLQRIANKLFGGLNEQEALHLRNVMAKAEHDRQVLSLLLLLIQTCDDHNGKALERSRKHLLNALIDIDSKQKQRQRQRQPTTTTRVPVTTYRRSGSDDFYTNTPSFTTTTELPNFSTTTPVGSYEMTTKFEIRVEDVDDDGSTTTAATPTERPTAATLTSSQANGGNSDRRALELLKSLYSLASKFSSRR